ncbi:ATP-binding protein [Alteromonas sediminis]|uniref:ATP-binding protein n=1 Tax=Alteromonas sediminis TaxID=2259342 RepID=A0A3N5Y3J1_9ALTE|nr:ATP-binding protein [Alteromonas sediminis]RPJ68492.1 ATP-binding protein [Alteromonas sediminis]
MPGLKRIILIDTHLPNVVELKLDGHTNICGTNASGKTTLQRLIPVFYGEYPSRVVPATRDSFEKWYLPRPSSFIIYEYERFEGDLCQAVLTSTGTGVNYRLIGKPFDRDDYLIQQKTGEFASVNAVDMARALKRNNILVSSQMGTKDFRAVIQNDQSTLTQSSNARELLGYARIFSVCDAAHPIRHIEKLAKAVHSKEGKMETIKTMVAAIMEEDGVQPPTSNLSKQRVDDWQGECQLIKSFDGIRPTFLQLEQANLALEDAEAQLRALKEQFSVDSATQAAELTQQQAQLEETVISLKQAESQWRDAQDTLNQTISSARADVDKYTRELDAVEEEYAQWQEKDIDQLKNDVEHLEQWQRALANTESRLALLTNEHQDAEASFNRRLAEIGESHAEAVSALHAKKQTLNDTLNQQRQEEAVLKQQSKEQYQSQLTALENSYRESIESLKVEKAECSSALSNAGFNSFEQSQLDLLDAAIKEAQVSEDAAQEACQHARQALQSSQRKREQASIALEKARGRYQQANSNVEKVKQMLFPGEGTLLEFLRASKPDWPDTIGKIIQPELLNQTKLHPTQKDEGDSLFGIGLDLSHLDKPMLAADEATLQTKLNEAESQASEALAAQNDAESALSSADEEVRNAELALTQKDNSVKSAQANRKRLQQDKDTQLSEYQSALAERKLTAKKRIEKIASALSKAESAHNAEKEALLEQQREAETEQSFHWQQLIDETQERIAHVDDEIASIKQDAEQEKQTLSQWLDSELNERGIDVDEIGTLKKQLATLQKDIQRTQSQRHLVADYTRWYDRIFKGQKVEWQKSLTKTRQTLSDAERELAKYQSDFKQTREQLIAKRAELEQSITRLSSHIEEVKSLHKAIVRLDLDEKGDVADIASVANTLTQRISLSQSLLKDRETQHKNVRDYVDMFDQMIATQAGTGLSDTWEKARQECKTVSEDGTVRVEHRKLVPHLSQLLNVIIPQKLQGLKEQGRIFGADLSQYYHVLVDIDKRIERQSRRLTEEVDSELYLDGVSNSAVKIRSRISELEFWPELEAFKQEHEAWLAEGGDQLPEESYGHAMIRVLDILGRAALHGGISKLLDIELHLREGNSDLVIRTDRQLNESSSHGMAYLILCKFLLAFTRLLRGEADVTIHWPIDELGTLHHSNIKKIFDACQNNNIDVVGAFPNPESEVLNLFENRYLIDKASRRLQVVQPKVNAISEKLKAKREAEAC